MKFGSTPYGGLTAVRKPYIPGFIFNPLMPSD